MYVPKSHNVIVSFNDHERFFKVISQDKEPVLQGYPAYEIKRMGWFVASDGHSGLNAIIVAPKEAKEQLELLFKNPTEYIKHYDTLTNLPFTTISPSHDENHEIA